MVGRWWYGNRAIPRRFLCRTSFHSLPPFPPTVFFCALFCLFVSFPLISSFTPHRTWRRAVHILLFKLILLWHNFFSHFPLYFLPTIFHSLLLTGCGVDLSHLTAVRAWVILSDERVFIDVVSPRLATIPYHATSLPTFSSISSSRIQCFVSTQPRRSAIQSISALITSALLAQNLYILFFRRSSPSSQ